jgi:hypothetical protein
VHAYVHAVGRLGRSVQRHFRCTRLLRLDSRALGYPRPLRDAIVTRLLRHKLERAHSAQVFTPTSAETVHLPLCFTQYTPKSPFHLERRMRSELSLPGFNTLLTPCQNCCDTRFWHASTFRMVARFWQMVARFGRRRKLASSGV